MKDLILKLPPDEKITSLIISSDKNDYISPLMQRAVTILAIHDDERMYINGSHIIDTVMQATATGVVGMLGDFISVGTALQEMLNEEDEEVSDVSFSVNTDNNNFDFVINITPVSEDTESAVLYSNG